GIQVLIQMEKEIEYGFQKRHGRENVNVVWRILSGMSPRPAVRDYWKVLTEDGVLAPPVRNEGIGTGQEAHPP
ncbi:MAG TPA: hypothetical protein VG125_02380, partial [Pirellulales bacterium]|nr:hypothetical protein [Pirellulales bacterium]